MELDEAKKLGQQIDSLVKIGKNGITDGIIHEVNRHLEDRDIVKIEALRNNPIRSIEKIASRLEDRSEGVLVETRGNTMLMVSED